MENELNKMAYLVRLREEHTDVRSSIERIERDWPWHHGEPTPASARELITELRQLRDDLNKHFDEEIHGGYLEEIVSQQPSLGPEADRIESEHIQLLAELEDIIHELEENATRPMRCAKLHRQFEQFALNLRTHEADESRLLDAVFGNQEGS